MKAISINNASAESDSSESISKTATIKYLQRDDLYKVQKPYETTFDTAELGGPATNHKFIEKNVIVRDAQRIRQSFYLDTNGFQFFRWTTDLSSLEFESDSSVVCRYYPEITKHVKEARPTSTHIHILSHARRDASISDRIVRPDKLYQPVSHVHADFTPDGAAAALEKYFQAYPKYRGRQYEMLNVWRVTQGPNRNWPLALCDYQSLSILDDVDHGDVIHRTYVGEQILLYENPNHRWYFLDNEEVEDVIVFRQTDSRGTHIPFGAHVSFENQSLQVELRKSIEVRLACFY